jgi:cytochrome c2
MKKLGVSVLITAFLLVLCVVAGANDGDIENGKKVYADQKCKLCHSIEGVGNKKSPLDGVGSKLSGDDIAKWIVSPKEMKPDSKMKAYTKLKEKDLEDLVAYMLSLKS